MHGPRLCEDNGDHSVSGANTLFLRLEGPLQSWGDTSKFVIRRSMEAPTKSGVLGLVCSALGLSRQAACGALSELNALRMGVRIDRPGMRWWDYQTVGARTGLTTAGGNVKFGAQGTLVTRREYLADASFLVALQGEAALIDRVSVAVARPKWPIFLGRRSCTPSLPVVARPRVDESWTNPAHHGSLDEALCAVPWRSRSEASNTLHELETLEEWCPATVGDAAPDGAEVWYDRAVSFDPPVHEPRLVIRRRITLKQSDPIRLDAPSPPRPRADYSNTAYQTLRKERIEDDAGLCVFCKSPGPRMTVHHVTYRRAGGDETLADLRSVCGLCHDALTMIEYGLGMGIDRIDPEDSGWRDRIIETRSKILNSHSLEGRRRRLAPEEV